MNRPTLRMQNLQLRYRKAPVLLELNEAAVSPGELVTMIGPNGGGKTTLLRTMAGLMPPAEGDVYLDGRSLYAPGALSRRERASRIAVVLTGAIAPGYLRVEELVELGRLPYKRLLASPVSKDGTNRERDAAVVLEAMQEVGVSHLARRRVGSLSDGERQRVLIARALAQEPQILLLDEPAAHLDPPHQTQLFLLLNRLIDTEVIASAVVATHNIHLALHFAEKLFLVAGGTVTIGAPCTLLDNEAIEGAFSAAPAEATSPGGAVEVALDRHKGWFVPRSNLDIGEARTSSKGG